MCSRPIVFEVVIDTIIRGLLFPLFLCITQVPPIASVRGSLCGEDVVRAGRACFVCDLGQVPRFPSRIQHSHCPLWGIEVQVPSQCSHGTTCSHHVVVADMHLHPHSTRMMRQEIRFASSSFEKLARGLRWQVVVDWGCPEAQHRQVRVSTAFLRLCGNLFHCLHCSLYESIRLRMQW